MLLWRSCFLNSSSCTAHSCTAHSCCSDWYSSHVYLLQLSQLLALPMSRQGWLALVSSHVPCLLFARSWLLPSLVVACFCYALLLCFAFIVCHMYGRITFFVALSSLPPFALVLLGGFSRWAHCVGSFVCKVSFSLLDCSPFAYHWLAFTLPEPLLLEFFPPSYKKKKDCQVIYNIFRLMLDCENVIRMYRSSDY